jgi:hypothetical protein
MRLNPPWRLLPVLALLALTGCSTSRSCFDNEDYLKAEERPPLHFPAGVTPSERIQPIEIPPLAPDPQKLNPQPRCLDYPPPFFAPKTAPPAQSAIPVPPAALENLIVTPQDSQRHVPSERVLATV